MISFDEFRKVEITVGKILSAEKVPETEKLLKLSVDFGLKPISLAPTSPTSGVGEKTPDVFPSAQERDIRQIVSGIATYFPEPQALVGKKCVFVTNLEPRVIRGLESNGMILAVSTDLPAEAASAQAGDGKFSLLEPSGEIPEGTRAK